MSKSTNMVHVEVLRHMKETIKAIMSSEDAALDAAIAALSAPQPPADAHCATCSCVPGMTPAVRFDATPAEKDGAVRDHLIRMGWTPPAEARCTCPSGDGSLRWPCPAHPPEAQAQGGGKVEYEFEVWQDNSLQAGGSASDYATAKSDADHYALIYEQDGPVEVRMYVKRQITSPHSAPVGVEWSDERIIDVCKAAGIHWIEDEKEEGGFPGGFNITYMPEMRRLFSTLAQQPAAVDETTELVGLLDEVRPHFTRDDDLPDDLLPRIDAALRHPAGRCGVTRWLVVTAWAAAGVYYAIAGVGGMAIAPFAALGCGWFAGRATRHQGGEP